MVTNDGAAVGDAGTREDDEDEVVTVHLGDEAVDRVSRILAEGGVRRSTQCLGEGTRFVSGPTVDPA